MTDKKLNIVHLIPGTGGSFYCENCIRDGALVKALRERGHTVTMVPLYLPLVIDEPEIAEDTPIFFGAVSTYLKEKLPFVQRFPIWIEKALNAAPVLKYAAGKAGSTRAEGLEQMTISMLKGTHGNQGAELNNLMLWLKEQIKPDIVYLANALLSGMAKSIRDELNIPVVCALEDEDVWLSNMEPKLLAKIWDLINENAGSIDRFLPVTNYYGQRIQKFIHAPAEKFTTTYVGIDLKDFDQAQKQENPLLIGYLSRMCQEMGLDILVDAFILLKSDPAFNSLKLHITGGKTDDDLPLLNRLKKELENADVLEDVTFAENFDRANRIKFLKGLSVLSVPARKEEAFGVFLIEALAAGVPLVQPATGGYPEIIGMTEGGITYEPNTPQILAENLSRVLKDKAGRKTMVQKGQEKVHQFFDGRSMSERLEKIYLSVIAGYKQD